MINYTLEDLIKKAQQNNNDSITSINPLQQFTAQQQQQQTIANINNSSFNIHEFNNSISLKLNSLNNTQNNAQNNNQNNTNNNNNLSLTLPSTQQQQQNNNNNNSTNLNLNSLNSLNLLNINHLQKKEEVDNQQDDIFNIKQQLQQKNEQQFKDMTPSFSLTATQQQQQLPQTTFNTTNNNNDSFNQQLQIKNNNINIFNIKNINNNSFKVNSPLLVPATTNTGASQIHSQNCSLDLRFNNTSTAAAASQLINLQNNIDQQQQQQYNNSISIQNNQNQSFYNSVGKLDIFDGSFKLQPIQQQYQQQNQQQQLLQEQLLQQEKSQLIQQQQQQEKQEKQQQNNNNSLFASQHSLSQKDESFTQAAGVNTSSLNPQNLNSINNSFVENLVKMQQEIQQKQQLFQKSVQEFNEFRSNFYSNIQVKQESPSQQPQPQPQPQQQQIQSQQQQNLSSLQTPLQLPSQAQTTTTNNNNNNNQSLNLNTGNNSFHDFYSTQQQMQSDDTLRNQIFSIAKNIEQQYQQQQQQQSNQQQENNNNSSNLYNVLQQQQQQQQNNNNNGSNNQLYGSSILQHSSNNLYNNNNSSYSPTLNKKSHHNHSHNHLQQQQKQFSKQQQKQGKSQYNNSNSNKQSQKSKGQINTAHVPTNLMNMLLPYLINKFENMPCKNDKSYTIKVRQQINCTCNLCEDLRVLKEMKSSGKNKSISSFRQIWGLNKLIRIISENYFLFKCPIEILGKKQYKNHNPEHKLSTFKCLPRFLQGSRAYTEFHSIL